MIKTWTFASGKGGVGKSTLAAAIAVALVRAGQKVVLVDMDIGLRSLDIHLGMENSVVYDVMDYVRGDSKLIQSVLMHLTMPELGLLPAAQLGSIDDLGEEHLHKILRKLSKRFDYVFVDAPAGLAHGLGIILRSVESALLVVTPDDVSIRDAERVIALCREMEKPVPMLIVNRVVPELVRSGDMYSPQTVADTLDVPLLGYVPEDIEVLRALHMHRTVMETDCPARHAVERITNRLMGYAVPMRDVVPPPKEKSGWFVGHRKQKGEQQ